MRPACSDASNRGVPLVSTPLTKLHATTLRLVPPYETLRSVPLHPALLCAPEFIRTINILAAPRIIRRAEAPIHARGPSLARSCITTKIVCLFPGITA